MARHQGGESLSRGRRSGARGTIRRRLAWILAFPLLAVVGLLLVVVTNDLAAYRSAQVTVRAVDLTLEVQLLVEELQHERGLANNVLGGDVSFRAELPRARSLVDEQLGRVGAMAAGGDAEARATAAALEELGGLETVRGRIDAGELTRAEAFAYFTERIAALSDIDFGLNRATDPDLRRAVAALEALGEVKEMTTQMRAFLSGVFAAGGFAVDEYLEYATIRAQQQAAIERYQRFAEPEQADLLAEAFDTGAAREAQFFEDRALAAVNQPFVVSPQSWWSSHTTIIDDLREAQESVGDEVAVIATALRDQATVRLAALSGFAVLSAAGAVIIVSLAARSITGPLAALATEARAMATERLPNAIRRIQEQQSDTAPEPPPVPVPKRATAEVLDVLEALNSAQTTAYSLATEQAILRRSTTESLANLGRRNQNLLRRQLGFITQLERDEVDPAGLANLFELDHLATRMRRNAESLLVLVGESSPRSWSEPLPVGDVLRAAISEVEDYRRVTLRRIDDALVNGASVAGIAHMVAELVENGIAFSPPDTDVEIQARMIGGQYVIGITDHGVGMSPDDLARANARLQGEESFLAAPTRFLGHYVVGHLARQLGVQAELTPSPVTGVTARVTLPASVLAAVPALDDGAAAVVPAGASSPRAIGSTPAIEHFPAPGADPPAPTHLPTPPPVVAPQPGAPEPAFAAGPTGRPGAVKPETLADLVGGSSSTFPAPRRPAAAELPVVGPVGRVGNDVATHVAHGGGERTRNGLLKRVSRIRTATPVRAEDATASRDREQAGTDSSPEANAAQLRSSLTSLRAGVARGRDGNGGDPQPPGSTHDS